MFSFLRDDHLAPPIPTLVPAIINQQPITQPPRLLLQENAVLPVPTGVEADVALREPELLS